MTFSLQRNLSSSVTGTNVSLIIQLRHVFAFCVLPQWVNLRTDRLRSIQVQLPSGGPCLLEAGPEVSPHPLLLTLHISNCKQLLQKWDPKNLNVITPPRVPSVWGFFFGISLNLIDFVQMSGRGYLKCCTCISYLLLGLLLFFNWWILQTIRK